MTNILLLTILKLFCYFTCKEYLVLKLCPKIGKIHRSDFSGLPLAQVSTFCSRVLITRKFKLLALEGPRQRCYSSTLKEIDYNRVVTKFACGYFQILSFSSYCRKRVVIYSPYQALHPGHELLLN